MTDEILRDLGIDPQTVNFSVHIVTPAEIRKLNKQFRHRDKVTDVLSFPLLHLVAGEKPTAEKFPLDVHPDTGKVELGDIVINKNEKDRDALVDHGLLHLLGYHHNDEEDDH